MKTSNLAFYDYRSARETFLGRTWSIHQWIPKQPSPHSVLCLHGFAGLGTDFEALIEAFPFPINWICPDLPGHGESDPIDESAISDEVINEVDASLNAIVQKYSPDQAPVLLAYSMGGRLALNSLVKNPNGFRQSFLLSVSPGISDLSERRNRQKTDLKLIESLHRDSNEAFFNRWNSQALFYHPSSGARGNLALTNGQITANLKSLAQCLKFWGPGWYPSFWDALHQLKNIYWITGEHDKKYLGQIEKIRAQNPKHQFFTVPNASHRILSDNPTLLAEILSRGIQFS